MEAVPQEMKTLLIEGHARCSAGGVPAARRGAGMHGAQGDEPSGRGPPPGVRVSLRSLLPSPFVQTCAALCVCPGVWLELVQGLEQLPSAHDRPGATTR